MDTGEILGVTQRWTSIPSRGSRNTPSCFMLWKPEISAGLMGLLVRKQKLRKRRNSRNEAVTRFVNTRNGAQSKGEAISQFLRFHVFQIVWESQACCQCQNDTDQAIHRRQEAHQSTVLPQNRLFPSCTLCCLVPRTRSLSLR